MNNLTALIKANYFNTINIFGVLLLEYCLLKIAAVMSGVNAPNNRILSSYFRTQKIITLSFHFFSKIE